jgi:transcriptional regulator with XRE-family HTH domain
MDERPGRPSWFRDRRPERWGLGDAIRLRREEIGLSRREVAQRAGLSYPYFSELETGKKRGSPESIRSVAEALGLGQDELWARADALAGAARDASIGAPVAGAALRRATAPEPDAEKDPEPEALAQKVADALAGASVENAEAALLLALGELRYRQAGPRRPPQSRFWA